MAEPYVDDLAVARAMVAGVDLDVLDHALASLIVRPAWHADAACRDADPRLFFPERGETLEPAKALCASCPVFEECDHYAATIAGPLQGVWAGLSERGRKLHRRAA